MQKEKIVIIQNGWLQTSTEDKIENKKTLRNLEFSCNSVEMAFRCCPV